MSAADRAIADLTAEVERMAGEVAAMRAAMDSLAKTEIVVKAIWTSGFNAGQEAGNPAVSRPVRRRSRHGLRVVAAGES